MFRATILILIGFALSPAAIKMNGVQAQMPALRSSKLSPRFVVGERAVYRIEYFNTSKSDFSALFGRASQENKAVAGLAYTVETSANGEIVETVLQKKSGGALVAYSFRQIEIHLRINNQNVDTETIQADLSRDIFAELNAEGKIISVRFDPEFNSVSQSFARTLLAHTQFVLPQNLPLPKEWETREEDSAGFYTANYRALPTASEKELKKYRKTKIAYEPRRSQSKSQNFEVTQTIYPLGSLAAQFDARRKRLISLGGTEKQTTVIADKTIAGGETNLQLNFIEQSTIGAAELEHIRQSFAALEQITAAVSLSPEASETADETAIQRTELSGETLETLLARLAQIEASNDAATDKTSLYLKFKALVYLHPETCYALGEVLARSRAGSATLLTLSGALGASAHQQAQDALIYAVKARPNDWAFLSALIPSLGKTSAPSVETENVLRDLAENSTNENIASTARLALGTLARNLAESSPERAARIVRHFIEQTNRAATLNVRLEMLSVLGNTGSALALPTIERFAASKNAGLRIAAVSALRFIENERAESLLIKSLAFEREPAVRLEAVAALSLRETGAASFNAQRRAFFRDKSPRVRLALLQNLWRVREKFPQANHIIEQSAAHDAAKEVREAAVNLIASIGKKLN